MQPGDLIRGKYRIVRKLGAGGHASVYQARQDDIGRDVAIKVLPKSNDKGYDTAIARFRREAKIIAKLEDPHTVSLFDYGQTDDDAYYTVFELLAGDDLSTILETNGALEEAAVVEILMQVLSSLREAHKAGIIHRDLKPANIMLAPRPDAPWFVKLIDFGIALPPAVSEEAALTRTGYAVGTPRFMCPEQLYGEPVTPSSDLFSLGLVVVELLLGPKGMDRPAIADGDLPDLGCSESLQQIVNRMLQHNPQARFARAEDVLDALGAPEVLEVTAPLPAPAPHSSLLPTVEERRSGAQIPPKSLAARVVGVASVVALAGLAGLAIFDASSDSAEPPAQGTRRLNPVLLKTAPQQPSQPPPPPVVAMAPDAGAEPECAHRPGTFEEIDELGYYRRHWMLHIPEAPYDGPRPILVFFHGAGFHPRDYISMGLSKFAAEHGFVIAAPVGEDAFAWTSPPGSVTWVNELIDVVAERACADKSKVFVWGDDTGGSPTMAVACQPNITAVSTSSYLPKDANDGLCVPNDKPYLMVNPTRSQHSPIDGNHTCPAGVPHLSLAEHVASWRPHNHCENKSTSEDRFGAKCTSWRCAAPLESCVVKGGQQWPTMPARVFDIFNCDGGRYKVAPTDLVGPFFAQYLTQEDRPSSAPAPAPQR